MTEVWPVYEEFSLISIENYIRFETAVKNLKIRETEKDAPPIVANFKIAREYYEQIISGEFRTVLIGLTLDYNEESSVMKVMPDKHFMDIYDNAIMRDVAFKQSEEYKVRYSKFIETVE